MFKYSQLIKPIDRPESKKKWIAPEHVHWYFHFLISRKVSLKKEPPQKSPPVSLRYIIFMETMKILIKVPQRNTKKKQKIKTKNQYTVADTLTMKCRPSEGIWKLYNLCYSSSGVSYCREYK